MLCYSKSSQKITHNVFRDLESMLTKNDVLVLNNTKVIPARFFVITENGKEVEILLVSAISSDNLTWKILGSPRKYLKNIRLICHSRKSGNPEKGGHQRQGLDSHLHGNDIMIEIIDPETIRFKTHDDLKFIFEKAGQMPLPPYIKRDSEKSDFDRYQTVFAKELGAVAAPTAALHFTEELLKIIKQKGVEIYFITLHVGPGTFLPIRTEDINQHSLMPEYFNISPEIWNKIQNAKKSGKIIIACGTTVARTLEYAQMTEKLSGLNDLFIRPGFKFNVVDSLITNFHLPKTTLLVLVSSFIGLENVKLIYEEAIKEKYRFFSYGDAMFIS